MENTSTAPSTGSEPASSVEAAADAFAQLLTPQEEPQEESEASEAQAETEEVEAEAEQAEETDEEEASAETEEDSEAVDEDDEADEEQQAPEPQAVEIDGQQVTVEELKKSYFRLQDYTRKTQQVAAQRKELAEAQAAIAEQQTQYEQLLPALRQKLEQMAPPEPDWDSLRMNDPLEFSIQFAEHQRRQQQLQAVRAEEARFEQQRAAQAEQAKQQRLAQAREQLVELVPEWRDAKRAATEKAALLDYGQGFGYTEQELRLVEDPRAVALLNKAYKYDQLMAKRSTVKPVAPKSPVLKPGAGAAPKKTSDLTRAKQRLAKTGHVNDAADAFLQLLNS